MANHVQGVIYRLHFDRPYRHASHCTGKPASSGFLKVVWRDDGAEFAELAWRVLALVRLGQAGRVAGWGIAAGVVQGEPLDPRVLASGLDRPGSVVGSNPPDGLGGGNAGQDRHAGQHRPGPSAPTATGNLDAPTRLCPTERLDDGMRRLLGVGGRPEIGPDNPVCLPAGLEPTTTKAVPPSLLLAGRALLGPGAADQVEPVVRQRTLGESAPQGPAPDQGAVGKLHGSTQCRAHVIASPGDGFVGRS
jgi:hypothetical protein